MLPDGALRPSLSPQSLVSKGLFGAGLQAQPDVMLGLSYFAN